MGRLLQLGGANGRKRGYGRMEVIPMIQFVAKLILSLLFGKLLNRFIR